MASEVADLFVILNSVTEPFTRGLKGAASEAESQSKRMSAALGTVVKAGLGLGAVAIGVGAESIKMASEFQSTMATLHTQAGVAKDQIAGLSNGVLNLAGQVGFAPNSLAEALYHIESSFASTGITGQKAMELLKVAAEGAATGHADLVDVTNALDAAVVSGIPGVSNLNDAMGMLNATVGSGDMEMQDLANAFSTGLLANVKSYGLTFRDVGAALAVFGDNNMRGQIAATDLRMAVQAMAKPASTASVELRKMGLDTDSLAKVMSSGGLLPALQLLHERMTKIGVTAKDQGAVLTDLFGKKAGAGIVVLYDQLGRLESKYPELDKGASGFADAWETTKQTFSQQMKDIGAGVDALGVRIGLYLIPQVSKLITTVQGAGSGIVSGFTGAATRPLAHDNLRNAFLNRDIATPPPLTGWQEFGEQVHRVLTDIEDGAKKLEPIGEDFLRFGGDIWQALQKIEPVALTVGHDLGVGLYLGAEAAGKIFANVLGPAIRDVANFIGGHQEMIRIFADVVLGGLALKMGVLGTINATKGLINLASAIVQFPLGQANQITSALDGVKVAFTGKDAKAGEEAVKGLKGAVGDLKGSVSGLLDKVPALDGVRLKLAGVKDGVSDVEKAASDTSKVEKLGADLEGTATSSGKAATSLAGLAGSFGRVAGPLALILGGAGLLGNYLGHLAGVGDHSAQSMDQLASQLQLAGSGSAQANDQFTKTATTLALMQATLDRARGGFGSFGAIGGGGQVQGLKDVDTALTNLVKSGNVAQAKAQFADIASALAKQNISADQVAADFPQYEQAVKNAGNAAQTADGQVSGLQATLSKQQALTQFQSDLSSLTQSIKDNGRSLFDNTDMARANQQAMQSAAGQIEDFYTQQRNAGVPIRQATSDLQGQVDSLEQTAIQAGLTKGDVDKYLASLGLIPSSIGTTITADIGPAMQQLGTLIEKIDSSTGVVQITGTGSGMYAGGKALTYADGGAVPGPKGAPRVAVVHGGEYVLSNDMQAGRQPIDPRVLSGIGLGSRAVGYVPGGGATGVVNNYYVVNVAGSVLSQMELENLVRTQVLRTKQRNSVNLLG